MTHPEISSSHVLIQERTQKGYLGSQWDNLFKEIVMEGWCVKSDGNVEAPTGYFSITEIPSREEELNEMKAAFEKEWLGNWPPSGWYITVEDNAGFMYAYPTNGERQAYQIYNRLTQIFSAWEEI